MRPKPSKNLDYYMKNSEITIKFLSLAAMITSTSFNDYLINVLITFNWQLALITQVVFLIIEKVRNERSFTLWLREKLIHRSENFSSLFTSHSATIQ